MTPGPEEAPITPERYLAMLTALLAPAVVFIIAFFGALIVDPLIKPTFYEATAQIGPVLMLALAIELNYVSGGDVPPGLRRWHFESWLLLRSYPILTLSLVVVAEIASLAVLAGASRNAGALAFTLGGLTAGTTGLIVSAVRSPTRRRDIFR